MRRRDFITFVGGAAAAWPLTARSQQPTKPVIGFLSAGLQGPFTTNSTAAFRSALAESGYVDGQSIMIDYRYAEGQYDRLPELAADLVRRQVSVIVATPNYNAAAAAKAATATIPILFMVSDDPVKLGLVASLNRPGGNATGVNYLLTELVAKRLQLLRELLPSVTRFSVLINPSAVATESVKSATVNAALAMGVQAEFVEASDSHEIDAAFAALAANKTPALLVAPDTFFANRNVQIVTLAARYGIPAIFTVREYVEAGGLISYGPNLAEPFRQLGIYTVRILRGVKPADLPVVQSSKIELVINQPTARALGLTIPPSMLATADEVIE